MTLWPSQNKSVLTFKRRDLKEYMSDIVNIFEAFHNFHFNEHLRSEVAKK